jgi:hypothetical protein
MRTLVTKLSAIGGTLLAVVLLCGLLLPAGITLADPGTSISIEPSTQTINQGESFTVNVIISTDVAARSAQFDLSWDANYIQIDSVTEGTFFSDWAAANGATTYFTAGMLNNLAGRLDGAAVALMGGSAGGVTGTGTFIQLHGTAKTAGGSGVVTLRFERDATGVIIGDLNSQQISGVQINDGTVVVYGSGGAQPTSTSQPTYVPTPTPSSDTSSGTPWGIIGGGIGALAIGVVVVAMISMKRQGKGKNKGPRTPKKRPER